MIGKILGHTAYWMVNKTIARVTSIEAALLLADLADKELYFSNRDEVDDEGYFFNTADNIQKDTTLTYHSQKKALKLLMEVGFIETKLKGVPAKLHFKIVENKILKFLNTGIEKSSKLELENFNTNKNKTNNNKLNKNKTIKPQPKVSVSPEKPKEKEDLFGKVPNKNSKVLFKNSAFFDLIIFKQKLKGLDDAGVDVEFYHRQINNWSESKTVKRTANGWVATARTFMEKDKQAGKLQMVKSPEEQKELDQDMIDYLNM